MSVIETRRPSSATGGIRRLFSNSHSQVGGRKRTSPIVIPKRIPGQGRELSIPEIEQASRKIGRYIRFFCDRVCPSAIFKTVFVQNEDTVAQCVGKVLTQLEKEGEYISDICTLYEVIGRLPPNSGAINEANMVVDPGETFTELSARPLPSNANLLNIFSLMAPAPGLCRRLELRRQTDSPQSITASPTQLRQVSPRTAGNTCIAPYCPFLLLIKGSRPECDLIVHSFSNICRGRLREITMGTSEHDNIRLNLSPEARNIRENIIIDGHGYKSSKAPIRFAAKSLPGTSKTKSVWMSVVSTYNAIQPGNPLTIALNWETLTDAPSFPVNRCLEPGDILRIEASNLIYVFIYKDSETVPEHKLSLGFLTLPQLPSSGSKPPIGQNGSRSAARTARIDALVRKASNSSNPGGINADNVLPDATNIEIIIGVLFPRPSYRSKDPNWGEIGGILPDVGVAAGCFAHLLRSVIKHGVETGSNEDDLVKKISHTLSRELEKLNKLASQHLIPAIWEAAFCIYLAQYLAPGWLKVSTSNKSSLPNVTGSNFPRIFVTESRRSTRLRSLAITPVTNSNIDSPSDVFAPPIQRPRQLYSGNGESTGSADAKHVMLNFELLPIFSSLREKVSSEAEIVINQAVQHSLSVSSRKVIKLCRLFGGASVIVDAARQIRETQSSLFDILDWTGNAINQALTAGTLQTESPGSNNGVIRLTQAQPYNERTASQSRMSATPVEERDLGGSSSRDSSFQRRSSSVIDSDADEEGDGTSPSGLSSLNIDAEIRSTPGEEDDTGFESSTTGGSMKSAKQKVESLFFCQFLVGLSKLIIDEFVNNHELPVNWETGVQLLNLVKALQKWMHNAGVQNYNDALQLLNDFASLMAAPRQELISMSWNELLEAWPNISPTLLYFVLKKYENGKCLRDAPNEDTILRENPNDSVKEYVKSWHPRLQRTDQIYRLSDLASLFSSVRSKSAIDSFDNVLAERGQTFRWSAFLRSYPPPGRIVQDNGSLSSSGLQSSNALLKNDSLEPGLLRAARLSSSDSSDFRDFAEPNANVTHGRSPGLFEALEIPLPTLSTEGPSRSILANRQGNYRRATESELGGRRSRGAMLELGGVQRVVPVAGGGFRSRLGVYGPAGSPANLQDWNTINGTLSASRARNYTRRSALKGNPLFASSLNISQSVDRTSTREAQKIRDDWSEFKRSLSRPTTPSTIAPDAETLNGSLSAYPSNQLIQSAYSFGTFPSRQRGNSLSSFIDSNLQKSQQSLISVDLDRPSGTAIMNVILEKVATETYGMKFVEGQTTRFGQLGVYVKSITLGTAASRGNIEIGDRILAINGKDVTGLTFKETCDLLKESVSRVTLTIQRGLVTNLDDLQVASQNSP